MDSKSQMDITADEDTTLLHLSHDLDTCISDLRKNVLESVTTIRARIHAQNADMIEGERMQRREHERRLLAQIDNLTIMLKERDDELAKQRLINERLVTKLFRQNTSGSTRNLAKKGLQAWYQYLKDTKYRKKLGQHLIRTREDREKLQLFHIWKLESQRVKFEELKEKMEGDHRRALAKATNEHHSSQNALQLEMLSMKESLQKEEEHRAILEERLKAAFMRGVCALNMEAMQVLKNTNEAGQENVSIASLLQNMNVTAGLGSAGDQTGIASILSNEPGTTERLQRQQQELQDQLNALQPEAQVPILPPSSASGAPMPTRRPLSSTYQDPNQNRNTSGTSGVVQVNPHYRPQSGTGAGRSIAAKTNSAAVTGKRLGATTSRK